MHEYASQLSSFQGTRRYCVQYRYSRQQHNSYPETILDQKKVAYEHIQQPQENLTVIEQIRMR
jgi:hypothetical protein